uniref:TFIIS N-terminal domain-containing protein n=1 Tax=Anopheles funestus TaxID=62324 RepID=A0A182RY30_ANOFN
MTDFDLMRESKKRKIPWWKTTSSPMICDQFVKRLLARMEQAAHKDAQLRADGKLVITKILLLQEFVEALQKTYLHPSLLEHGVLRVIELWIKPMANGKVTYHEITKRLIESLLTLVGIEVKHLKQCGLAKILLKLRVNQNETQTNRQLANELVTRWIRVNSYRSLHQSGNIIQPANFPNLRLKGYESEICRALLAGTDG